MAEAEDIIIGILVSSDQLITMMEALNCKFGALKAVNQICVEARNKCLAADDWDSVKKIEAGMEKNDRQIAGIKYLVEYIAESL